MYNKRILYIFFIFFSLRFIFFISYDYKKINGDQISYHKYAKKVNTNGISSFFYKDSFLKKGHYYPYSFGNNPVFWEPLYNFVVSIHYYIFGLHPFAIGIFQLFISLLSFFISWSIVKKLYPDKENVNNKKLQEIFLGLFATYISLAGFIPRLYPESLDVFLLLCLFWFFIQIDTKRKLSFYFFFGLTFGLYLSLKAYWSFMLIPLFTLVVFILLGEMQKDSKLVKQRGAKKRNYDIAYYFQKFIKPLMSISIVLFVFYFAVALIIVPVQIRTYLYTGQFSIATKTAYNLWKDNNNFSIENSDYKEKGAEKHKWIYKGKGHPDKKNPPRNFASGSLASQTSYEKRQAINFLLNDPIRFFKRAIIKNMNLWSPNTYVLSPSDAKKRFHIKSKLLRGFIFHFIILQYIAMMFLAFLGIILPSRNKVQFTFKLFFIVIIIYTSAIISWGHGQSRYRIPLMPEILMFSALGILNLKKFKQTIFQKNWRSKILLALIFLFSFIIFEKRYIVAGIGRGKAYYFGPTFQNTNTYKKN